jgi:hypothetical protein
VREINQGQRSLPVQPSSPRGVSAWSGLGIRKMT